MDVSPRPGLMWRIFVVLGLGTAGAVSVSDPAWERWQGIAGDAVPRDTMRSVFWGSLAVHAGEGAYAYGAARCAGLDRPGRWGRSAMLWGFPVLLRLRRARRSAAA